MVPVIDHPDVARRCALLSRQLFSIFHATARKWYLLSIMLLRSRPLAIISLYRSRIRESYEFVSIEFLAHSLVKFRFGKIARCMHATLNRFYFVEIIFDFRSSYSSRYDFHRSLEFGKSLRHYFHEMKNASVHARVEKCSIVNGGSLDSVR